MHDIRKALKAALTDIGIDGDISFSPVPNPEIGDLAFPCFSLAKVRQSSPADIALSLATDLSQKDIPFVLNIQAAGPYVNFFLDPQAIATHLFSHITSSYGSHKTGKGERFVVEYGCPNPMKAFHLGHLKNLITGESVCRVFSNVGREVIRVNYQGDVGMHIAKSLWGIFDWIDEFHAYKEKPLQERVEFLGRAYAHGAQHFEKGVKEKEDVVLYNEKVYTKDASIQEVYDLARSWSLSYFDTIYSKLGSCFDRLYFESEVFERGVALVSEGLEKGIFTKSDGAVIYEGSKHDLHDRVFLNSKGFPTYEAKDLALAEMHFADFSPHKVVHVVGKEQTEYFKVVFSALSQLVPQTTGKEYHLPGGYLQLKGDKKMSSRLGNIITGDALIFEVEKKVREIMSGDLDRAYSEDVLQKVSTSALKYAMLKSDVSQDVAFDMETSVSTSGESGPYLLYIVARINSILRKAGDVSSISDSVEEITVEEKQLLLKLSRYPDVTLAAAAIPYDPSKISRYLFDLAQSFNAFYHVCPVLQAKDADVRLFRLTLIKAISHVMTHGLALLGIETVEEM